MYKKIHGKQRQRDQALKNRRRGRRQENTIAGLLGFTKAGLYGEQDAFDAVFSAEIKDRKLYVGDTMFQQAIKNAGEKIPLLIVHKTHTRRENSLVHMKLKDWKDMYIHAKKGGYPNGKT